MHNESSTIDPKKLIVESFPSTDAYFDKLSTPQGATQCAAGGRLSTSAIET